jgi:anaerobic magnesium-protoporphyrin IX monomethyl ester cyclase
LSTNHISAAEVLKFRDKAWHTYFTNPAYLDLVEKRFDLTERENVEEMAFIYLKCRILGV